VQLDVHDITAVGAGLAHLFVVVSLVGTEVLWCFVRGLGTIGQNTVQGIFGQRVVRLVRCGQDQAERDAMPIGNDASFGAKFAAVDRAGARKFPPKGAGTVAVSTICHSQSIPLRSS
jgi:hypothetical protein